MRDRGLRVHFTAGDLARIRVSAAPDPMWELVLSLHVLQAARVPVIFADWRRDALRAADAAGLRDKVRLLATLVAPRGDFPDFLTPAAGAGFGAALDEVLATPRGRLRGELGAVFAARPAPGWVLALADGDREALAELGRALTAYRRAVVEPSGRLISDGVHADRELRALDLMSGGAETLLAGLPHPIEWRPPTLYAPYPRDRDVDLGGRGLTLIPSFFCWGTPVTLMDPALPPVLVYPAGDAEPAPPETDGLSALVGHSRARALAALRVPSSTTELARRSGMSITSASKHAAVLRDAGLVTSTRRGNMVIHSLTRLGRDLLSAR